MDKFFIRQLDATLERKEKSLVCRMKRNGNALADPENKGEGVCGGVKVPVVLDANMSTESINNRELSEIRTVRAKIKEGKLETCSHCGNPIEKDRLEVMLNLNGDSIVLDCMACHGLHLHPNRARVSYARLRSR